MTMTASYIEEIARTVVGDHTGWQARFADAAGISRAHLSNVLKGTRPVTDDFKARVLGACVAQSDALRARATRLDEIAIELGMSMPTTIIGSAPVDERSYEDDADEAEDIVNRLAASGQDIL